MVSESHSGPSVDVLVVGGGIIGLAVAWRARQRGLSVLLLERDRFGAGASSVAAGMLAPVTEVEFDQARRRTLDLGLRSAALWSAFAAELGELTGVGMGYRHAGTLMVARDADDARELERQLVFRESLGVKARRLLPSQARELEPALTPTVRLALEAADDHSVNPQQALGALASACERAGVLMEQHTGDVAVALDAAGDRVEGVRMANGSMRRAGQVVLATGAWGGMIAGLRDSASVPVRPVKGQILRLRDPAGPGLLTRAVRGRGVYIVPRDDGRYVLGATMEERGFELNATAGGVYELLRDAHELVPGVAEFHLEHVCVGLRPGTPDNAPLIGRSAHGGLIWACGHFRNGILLAPLTAELVSGVLTGQPVDPLLEVCDPARFGVNTPTGSESSGALLTGVAR